MWRALVLFICIETVLGQGRLLDPPGRSSLWRLGFDAPINNNDNVLSCGGLKHRWSLNKGECGVCGDPYDQSPRENEAGGKYAGGIISSIFTSGALIDVIVDVANVNGGYFEFRLCANNNITKPVTAECLDKGLLHLGDGSTRFTSITDGENMVALKLPENLECDQCILQWKYNTGDNYGCDVTSNGTEECGFGKGKIQTEYFACADIAIYPEGKLLTVEQKQQEQGGVTYTVVQPDTPNTVLTSHKRIKRTPPHFIGQSQGPGIAYLPFRGTLNIRIRPLSAVQWPWRPTPSSRIRRRVHQSEGHSEGRGMPGRMHPGRPDRQVRMNFNMRRNQNLMFPFEDMQAPPQPALVQAEEPTVVSVPRQSGDHMGRKSMRNMNMANPMMNNYPANLQRSFIDPLNTDFGTEVSVHKITQTVMSNQFAPTKKCQYCPFDQCLDDQLRIDGLFPGLFEEPRTFLECKRYDKLFTVGNYDVVKEGMPECTHPRFKRQLMGGRRMEDDDVGCCSTRSQVILPLTVDSENDTFNVVQLGNDKKQLIVQGTCGRGNTTSCTVCSAENNFQWVLVYDSRVNTQPPVTFVPVKFPHYCRCYNYRRQHSFGSLG